MRYPLANSSQKQGIYIKLYFAHNFGVSEKQLATAMGYEPLILTHDVWYNDHSKELTDYLNRLHRRTFDKHSFLAKMTEHFLRKYDREAIILNMTSKAIQ